MTGRAVLTAIGPLGVRRYRIRLLRGHRQSNGRAAMDRSAPKRNVRRSAAWQRPRPDAEIVGGEVSFEPPFSLTSLDHLVGAGEQLRRHLDAQRLRGFEVDCQLVLRRCLY